ncbi:hypothetical protein J1605_019543 [Eschrichtius robustus]|uniref:Uncharacterized protein n=1 Tax=Eschrichtius robustus TaxID=9764 RepID=A0AB34HKE5_ESCRO|nr:hypothetical protein J1605_019543 [Eschrichtius robustus]
MWVSAVVVTLLLSSYRDFEAEGRKGNWNGGKATGVHWAPPLLAAWQVPLNLTSSLCMVTLLRIDPVFTGEIKSRLIKVMSPVTPEDLSRFIVELQQRELALQDRSSSITSRTPGLPLRAGAATQEQLSLGHPEKELCASPLLQDGHLPDGPREVR